MEKASSALYAGQGRGQFMIHTRRLLGLMVLVSCCGLLRAQTPENIQEWKCLASSAAIGSIFSSAAASSGCSIPIPVRWPGARMRAEALVAAATAPINLTASVSGSTVVLNWTASAGATSYIIQVGSSSGASNLANSSTGSSSPTLTATGVPPGTYFVRVLAQDASGVSAP